MKNSDFIYTLIDCALECENCQIECLNEANPEHLKYCIELTRDCADICFLAARLVERNSPVLNHYLKVCEEICRNCGEECKKHSSEHCQRCNKICISCMVICHENNSSLV